MGDADRSKANTNITEAGVSDAAFAARFLAYVDERAAYHAAELAKLDELRNLWAERQVTQEVPHGDAG